jgi:hypothetical protein
MSRAARPPAKLQQVAVLQLISGVVNVFVMAAVVSLVLGSSFGVVGTFCGGLLSIVGCPVGCLGVFGWMCGFWGLALLPVGILEMVAGMVGLINPEGSGTVLRVTAVAELASLLFGGIVSTVIGVVALGLLRDEEVVGYLEG